VTFLTSLKRVARRQGSPEDRGKLLRWPPVVESVPLGFRQHVARLGPGIVTGASDVDPALVLTATVAGAAYGYSLLWVVPLCVPFLLAIFTVAARIGHETRRGLVELLRQHYGKTLAIGCAALVMVINLAMIIADLLAVTDALSIILDQRRIFFVAAVAFSVWYILIFRDYHKIVHALVWLSLPLFAYVIAAVLASPPAGTVLRHTFWPQIMRGQGYATAVVALFGSLLTPYVVVWQTSSRSEAAARGDETPAGSQHQAGAAVTTLISYCVLIAAAAVLNPVVGGLTSEQINSLTFRQAAQALSPLGEIGPLLFAIGIIGAGMVALPVLVASMCYATSEALGWKTGLSEHPWEAKSFYVLISAVLFLAAAANFFRMNAVSALYWSQILAGILAVPIFILILVLSNDRRIMRTTNSGWQNFWLGAASGAMIAAGAAVFFWKIFG